MQFVIPFEGGSLHGKQIVWSRDIFTYMAESYRTEYVGTAKIPNRYIYTGDKVPPFRPSTNFTEKGSKLSMPESFWELDYGRQCKVYNQLQSFVNSAVTKYVAGQKEHGGKLEDRPCFNEMHNEILDLMWYWYAENERRAVEKQPAKSFGDFT